MPIRRLPNYSKDQLSLIQIHFGVFLAAGSGLFAKFIALSPSVITCGRTAFGSLALAVVVAMTGSNLRLHSVRDWLMLAFSGAILAAYWFTFFRAIQVSTVAIGLLDFSTFSSICDLSRTALLWRKAAPLRLDDGLMRGGRIGLSDAEP